MVDEMGSRPNGCIPSCNKTVQSVNIIARAWANCHSNHSLNYIPKCRSGSTCNLIIRLCDMSCLSNPDIDMLMLLGQNLMASNLECN